MLLKIHFFFLYCSVVADNVKEEKLTVKHLSSQSLWPKDWPEGRTQIILINSSEVWVVKDALNALHFYDYGKESETFDSEKQIYLAARASKILFLAQKCKYSSLIINVLRMYFESISSCQKLILENSSEDEKISNETRIMLNQILHSTADLKKYITQLIFSTKKTMKSAQNLKSADHSFLKSLLAINLWLYTINIYSNQQKQDFTDTNVNIDIKRSFAQMINLIERFRCKNCLVVDYFESNLVMKNKINETIHNDKLTMLMSETLKTLQINPKEISVPKNRPNYAGAIYEENMYDPKYMLLGYILEMSDYSFVSTLLVRWKNTTNWLELTNVYKEVSKSLDLQTIYDYQVFVIEIIKEMFFIKFLNTEIHQSNDIENILEAFKVFIDKMVPSNYPTNLHVSIKNVLSSLHSDIRSASTESHPTLSNRSIKLLHNYSILVTSSTSYNLDDVLKNVSMYDFIQQIVSDSKFTVFVELFKELSYESNTLDDYDFHRVNSFKVNQNVVNRNACDDLSAFRKNLLLLHMLTVRFQQDNVAMNDVLNSSVQEAKAYVFDNIMHLYKTYENHSKIKQIVLPLMVRFKYTHAENADYRTISQTLILNLNLIEHVELIDCPSPKYNVDMFYDEVKDYQVLKLSLVFENEGFYGYKQKFWQNKENLTNILKSNTKDHRRSDKERNIDSLIADDFVPFVNFEYQDSDPKSTLFLWDGSLESIHSISRALPKSIIDYQHLVRHQCFVMKWIISKIIMNFLKFIFIIYDTAAKSNDTDNVRITINYLTMFEELPFPKSVRLYLRDIFYAFDALFRVHNEETKEKYTTIIIKSLNSFQPSLEELSIRLLKDQKDVSSINVLIEKDMDSLKNILNGINNSKIITDVAFSSCIYTD